jgi:phosphoribosylformylglycinamidine (FGAM) synthase PurS component
MSSPRVLPTATYTFEVRLRPEFSDPEGTAALALLQEAGAAALKEVRVARLYEIRGPLSPNQAQQAAKDLLSDPVTQEVRLVAPAPAPMNGMNFWRVEVWLKENVSDPVGQTVRDAIAGMGLPRPELVRVASAYRVTGRSTKASLEKAVSRCLANPIIHRAVISEAHP